MRTYACCDHCRVRTHVVMPAGSAWRDDHPHPCAKCPEGGRGRQEVAEPKLAWSAAA